MSDPFRDDVLPSFERSHKLWLWEARRAALILSKTRPELTVDDVREICPPPPDRDPRVMGAIFRTPEWEFVRYERSRRRMCHHRFIAVFRRIT